MVEITAGAGSESRNEILAISAAKHLLQVIGIISAVFGTANSVRVHRENCKAGKWALCAGFAGEQNADISIGGSGGANDVCVELAGIEGDLAVFHPITAIES